MLGKGPTWRRGFVNYFLRVQHLFCSCPAAKNYLNVVCGSPWEGWELHEKEGWCYWILGLPNERLFFLCKSTRFPKQAYMENCKALVHGNLLVGAADVQVVPSGCGLGLVDYNFGCSSVCLIIWHIWLCPFARWWHIRIKPGPRADGTTLCFNTSAISRVETILEIWDDWDLASGLSQFSHEKMTFKVAARSLNEARILDQPSRNGTRESKAKAAEITI